LINFDEFLFESKCAKEFEQKKYLMKLLGNKKIKTTLFFRGSINGMNFSSFHMCCDNKGPTISLIQLLDGDLIGGVTYVSWSSTNTYKSDNESFLVNLTRRRHFPSLKSGTDLICYRDYGVAFTGGSKGELSLF